MSRKKSRPSAGAAAPPQRSAQASTAVQAAPPSAGVSMETAVRVQGKGPVLPMPSKPAAPPSSWLENFAIRMSRTLGSLQVAVVGLAIFAFVLAIGTMVESWYTGKLAQELIYRSWWFLL